MNGGEGGIRTHGTLARSPVFKTGAFDHSATSPNYLISKCSNMYHFKINNLRHIGIEPSSNVANIAKNKSINVIWDGYWPAPKKHKNINLLPQQYWDIYPLFLLRLHECVLYLYHIPMKRTFQRLF